MSFNESTVENAALTWFGELGYTIGHGPHLTPKNALGDGRCRAGQDRRHLTDLHSLPELHSVLGLTFV